MLGSAEKAAAWPSPENSSFARGTREIAGARNCPVEARRRSEISPEHAIVARTSGWHVEALDRGRARPAAAAASPVDPIFA